MTRPLLLLMSPARLLGVALVLLIGAGCAHRRDEAPEPTRARVAVHRPRAERGLLLALRGWEALAQNPDNATAAAEYAQGTREFLQAMIDSARPNAWRGVHAVPSAGRTLTVALGEARTRGEVAPAEFDRLLLAEPSGPADGRREGVGVPLLARVHEDAWADHRARGYPNNGQFVPLTAWLEFSAAGRGGTRATLHLSDPRELPKVRLGGATRPLAANFRTPANTMLVKGNIAGLAVNGLLRPERFVPARGVYLGEPYDPQKIPVILTHGLLSDPSIWENLTVAILSDPELGRRYQVWYFAYPTGEPVLNTARAFRRSLASVRRYYDPRVRHVASRHLVLVGHSMGGLVSQLMTTDSAEAFYRAYFTRPLEELRFRPSVQAEIRGALFFHPLPGVRRAIFIATPHRGSALADSTVGGLGRRLVSLPKTSLKAISEIVKLNPDALNPLVRQLKNLGATSLDTLSPRHPYFSALESRPITAPFHSIIGDRGKPGPQSNDGVVPYTSSHLDGAESERLVPYGHGCVERPETVAEVMRILRQHVAGAPRNGASRTLSAAR